MIPSPSGLPRIVPVLKWKILHLKNPSGKLGQLVPLKKGTLGPKLIWGPVGTSVHPSLKLKWLGGQTQRHNFN